MGLKYGLGWRNEWLETDGLSWLVRDELQDIWRVIGRLSGNELERVELWERDADLDIDRLSWGHLPWRRWERDGQMELDWGTDRLSWFKTDEL